MRVRVKERVKNKSEGEGPGAAHLFQNVQELGVLRPAQNAMDNRERELSLGEVLTV